MSFFSPVNQARWALSPQPSRLLVAVAVFNSLSLQPGRRAAGQRPPAAGAVPGPAVRPGVKNYTEQTFGGAFATAADYQDPGCSSSWRLTAGRYGRQYASARRQLILPARFPSIAALSQQLARHRRQRRRCAGADPLWDTHLGALRSAADAVLQRARGAGRGDTGLLRR